MDGPLGHGWAFRSWIGLYIERLSLFIISMTEELSVVAETGIDSVSQCAPV